MIYEAKLREQLEQARVQLAGCLIAAEGGDTSDVKEGDYAWTLALEKTRKLFAQLSAQPQIQVLSDGIDEAVQLAEQRIAELERERDGLRAERDRFVARHEQVLAERNQFELDAIALRERLAVGEADALRLDWMERHHASIWWGGILERREGPDPNAVALEWLDAGDLVNQSERFRTLREAIDAVLAARTPGGNHEAE